MRRRPSRCFGGAGGVEADAAASECWCRCGLSVVVVGGGEVKGTECVVVKLEFAIDLLAKLADADPPSSLRASAAL